VCKLSMCSLKLVAAAPATNDSNRLQASLW
jgi:hypothetical protein